jgi:PAS domain S-box-containing protein
MPTMPPQTPQSKSSCLYSCRSLGIACLVVLSFAWGGYRFINTLEKTAIEEHYTVLETLGQMKNDQFLAWRKERLADGRMNASGLIKTLLQEWLRTGNPQILQEIAGRLEFFRENEGYHNMILTDTSGKILVSLIDKTTHHHGENDPLRQHELIEPEEKTLLKQVLTAHQPVLGDFYYCSTCRRPHINVGAPIVDKNNQSVAVLFLINNPEQNIFPLLKTWPMAQNNKRLPAEEPFLGFPGPSYLAQSLIWPAADIDTHGASILVRREAHNALIISPMEYPATPPLSFRVGLSHTENPAVRAILGETGMARGPDCFGEEILADLRAVPGTTWYLITKMDLSSLLTKVRFQGGGLLLLFALTIGMTVLLARLVTVSRQKNLSEALLLAERERAQTREEIRATLYGIADGVMATDASGLITRMNPEAERLTGWKEAAAIGVPLTSVFHAIHEETETLMVLPIDRVLMDGETIAVSNHILLIAQNGLRWPVTDSWSPIRNEEGRITGVVLVFRDQTKKKAMEKARAESAKRYSDLVDSVHDLIWETGPDFCFTFVSERIKDMLGYRPEEIIGELWDNILLSPVALPSKRLDAFLEDLVAKKPYSQHVQTLLHKDGSKVIVESSATPVFDKQRRFLGYRGVSRDITQRRQAEEEQKKLQAQLLQAQKMDTVGRLAGGIAHDFNNMLTVICSYVEMTLDDLGEKHPLYKRLLEVHLAAQHSADLTRQLLAFARKQVIAPRILDLNTTIEGTLKMLHRLIGENIKLAWNPGPDLWKIEMDATQVSQLLANLVVNARDAIDGTGTIRIATANTVIDPADCTVNPERTPGNFVQIRVSDDGSGIDRETLTQIFEPFFTTKGEGKGTGLGLATVYGVVKQNKGVIEVASEPGQGTTFTISLPRAQLDNGLPLTDSEEFRELGTETILLVEDEPSILELATYILEQRGYTVLPSLTPTKALALALEHRGPIDLLITDVIMPEINGRELAKEILIIRPEAKFLFMSGYTSDILAQNGGMDTGIHFLEKPFSASSLVTKVRQVINQNRPGESAEG